MFDPLLVIDLFVLSLTGVERVLDACEQHINECILETEELVGDEADQMKIPVFI
jgi:hypothetical protein